LAVHAVTIPIAEAIPILVAVAIAIGPLRTAIRAFLPVVAVMPIAVGIRAFFKIAFAMMAVSMLGALPVLAAGILLGTAVLTVAIQDFFEFNGLELELGRHFFDYGLFQKIQDGFDFRGHEGGDGQGGGRHGQDCI
jgi:hypothetical protein